MVSSQVQISHPNGPKSGSPQPFSEPEGMMTIELNQNESEGEASKSNPKHTKFKLDKNLIVSMAWAICIFIIIGLLVCFTLLICIVEYNNYNKGSVNPRLFGVCKTARNLQECCETFIKIGLVSEIELCTVEKVLDIVLTHERKINKRTKRQDYADYYQQNQVNEYDNPKPRYAFHYPQEKQYFDPYNQHYEQNYAETVPEVSIPDAPYQSYNYPQENYENYIQPFDNSKPDVQYVHPPPAVPQEAPYAANYDPNYSLNYDYAPTSPSIYDELARNVEVVPEVLPEHPQYSPTAPAIETFSTPQLEATTVVPQTLAAKVEIVPEKFPFQQLQQFPTESDKIQDTIKASQRFRVKQPVPMLIKKVVPETITTKMEIVSNFPSDSKKVAETSKANQNFEKENQTIPILVNKVVPQGVNKLEQTATLNNQELHHKTTTKKILNQNETITTIQPIVSSTRNDSTQNLPSKEIVGDARINQGSDFNIKTKIDTFPSSGSDIQAPTKQVMGTCFYPYPTPFASPYRASIGMDGSPVFTVLPTSPPQHLPQTQSPMFVVNPQMYPYIPVPFQNFQSQQMLLNPMLLQNQFGAKQQFTSSAGQYFMCNPLGQQQSGNLVSIPGVEVRRTSQPSNLQELLLSQHIEFNNKSREAMDCPEGQSGCADGSKCINIRHLCDNQVDCGDGSDEMACTCRDRIEDVRLCDGYQDCPNGEDEADCFGCQENEYSCDDWSRFRRGTCIPIHQRCDGFKQCDITGKDEEDCTILTDHLQHHPLRKVSNAAGFLHRNFRGVWYPTCFGTESFSVDVCKIEAGPSDLMPKVHMMESRDQYNDLYLTMTVNNQMELIPTCAENHAMFVECPPLFCGLRMSIHNPFRALELDTSSEDFLNQMQRAHLHTNSTEEPSLASTRVVGGKACQPAAWPWVVSIYKNGIFHCGGVLINELWIVTAAHCVDKYWFFYYEIQAGMLRRFSYSPMEQNRFAIFAMAHEGYDKHSLKNDIALMKMSAPVRYNRYVRPICLPSASTAGDDFLKGPEAGSICSTVGWGATVEHGADPDHMREVEVPIIGHCKHRDDREGDEICAGLFEGGRDACQGDSGGPLMCKNPNNPSQWYLAGIVSHGEGCARPNEPGVYTKVSNYLGWIAENMREGKSSNSLPLHRCPGYTCKGTKRCLPKKRHCDKIVDCLFGDDENNCWQNPASGGFVGAARKEGFMSTILNLFGVDDLDKSTFSKEIKKNETTKSSTKKDVVPNYFTCQKMLQRIPLEKKCDKKVDCEDGTDEGNCSCADFLKQDHPESICDGLTDCKDLSDEIECTKCLTSEFLCRTTQQCIPLELRCNDHFDCYNGDDEWDCVALTNGKTLILDSDLRPKQAKKGIVTVNRFGIWQPLCMTPNTTKSPSTIATNICNVLGFEDYTTFHKVLVPYAPLNSTLDIFENAINTSRSDETTTNGTTCSNGLFVTCLNVSLASHVHDLLRDNVTKQVELYTAPWNAVIYVNGQFKCMGTIINAHWILTTRSCVEMGADRVGVLLGKGKAHLDAQGPHELALRIQQVAPVNGTDIVLLRSDERIFFTRYIQPAYSFDQLKTSLIERCVAFGSDNNRTTIVLLKSQTKCEKGHKCFSYDHFDCNETHQSWNGIITCDSRSGWYPAATYNSCHFENSFLDLTQYKVKFDFTMGDDPFDLPDTCPGYECLLGTCLPLEKLCNGIEDCRGGEDEDTAMCEHCHLDDYCVNSTGCPLSKMRCKNGKCVEKTSFCDLKNDCGDYSDEPSICSCRSYLELAHPERLCDGVIHCEDRSDEDPDLCPCSALTAFQCGDKCVPEAMVCDGVRDCTNGKDETMCYSLKTTSLFGGEVLERTAGVWHSGCFPRHLTSPQLEEICESIGFAGGGSARKLAPPEGSSNRTTLPTLDGFEVVWIRHGRNKLKLQMRTGNSAYLTFGENAACNKLYIECL